MSTPVLVTPAPGRAGPGRVARLEDLGRSIMVAEPSSSLTTSTTDHSPTPCLELSASC